ncbi:MAG: transposase, partial [Candidatus Nanoarchaeia archaeon]|nr:transposase [Candidatus Nanoarchaeia archaeon]
MHQTYVYKLYNNKRKNKYLNDKINLAGSIYNHCIALHKKFYSLYNKSLNKYKLQKHITKLKKTKRFNYWNNISIDVIQQITDRIETAYKLFFNNLKRKRKCSPPSFKKIRKYKSITFKKSGYKFLEDNKIRIMSKTFKIFKSRTMYYNKICTVTIKRNNIGEFFIYIVVENDDYQNPLTRSGKSVGMDFGLKTFLTLSNNNKIESPLFFNQNINEIKKLSKQLSKKNKKSNNYKKSLIKLNRLYIDLFNKKKDYFYKLSIELCQQFDLIAIEDLNISAMKKLWG